MSNVDISEAANQARAAMKTLRPFIVLAETLEKMVSLGQAEREAVARCEKARADALEAQAQLASISGLIDDATTKASEILTSAGFKADALVDDAMSSHESIVKDANVQASKILGEAKALKAGFDTQIGQLRAEAATLTHEVNSKGDALNKLKAEMSALKLKLG